jgi:integrase
VRTRVKQVRTWFDGDFESATRRILDSGLSDKYRENVLGALELLAEFLGVEYSKPKIRVYIGEKYVPNPEVMRCFVAGLRGESKIVAKLMLETGASLNEALGLRWVDVGNGKVTIRGLKGHRSRDYRVSQDLYWSLCSLPRRGEKVFTIKDNSVESHFLRHKKRLFKETGNPEYLKITPHTCRHFAISWHYFKTKDIVETQRFARHCNIQNTLTYVHIVKGWIKENEFDVVYADGKDELTRYLAEGYELVTRTEWGYCLRKPKTIT